MKRTKQLQVAVDNTNRYLRINGIKDERNPAFMVMMYTLMDVNSYKGFNYFNDREIGDETVSVLAGSSTDFDYLQLY